MIVRHYRLSPHEWHILERADAGHVYQDGIWAKSDTEPVHGTVVDLLNMGLLKRGSGSALYRPTPLGAKALRRQRRGDVVVLAFTGSEWRIAEPAPEVA